MTDYCRFSRVASDIICCGAGAFCLVGFAAFSTNQVNPPIFSLCLLLGAAAGLTQGATEHPTARRCAVVLVVAMFLTHVTIQRTIARLGLTIAAIEPMMWLTAPAIVLILMQALDWLVRRGRTSAIGGTTTSGGLRWLLRCGICLAAAVHWSTAWVLVRYATVGVFPIDWKFGLGLLTTCMGAIFFTRLAWTLTQPTNGVANTANTQQRWGQGSDPQLELDVTATR